MLTTVASALQQCSSTANLCALATVADRRRPNRREGWGFAKDLPSPSSAMLNKTIYVLTRDPEFAEDHGVGDFTLEAYGSVVLLMGCLLAVPAAATWWGPGS